MSPKATNLIKLLSPKERLILGVVSISLIASLIAGGLWFLKEHTAVVPAEGGSWREGVIGQPMFINPVISGSDIDQDISHLVFAKLGDMSEKIVPDSSNREWTIRIKEGLKWHDGEKITSDDVIFTFDTAVNPESRSPLAANFEGAAISRISELELKFTLPSSYVFFGETLNNLRVIPKHIFGNIPPANFNLSAFVREPIGSGPYRYDSYSKNRDGFVTEYRLTANPDWFGDKPYIKNIAFLFYSDEKSLIQAYNNGEIDGFVLGNPNSIKNILVRYDIKPLSAPRYYAVFLNPSLVPAFRSIDMRHTLSDAISRDKIVKDAFAGYATPAFGPFSSSTPADTRGSASSITASYTIVVPDIPQLVLTANIISSDWAKLGITITVNPMRPADIQQTIRDRSYEMILFGNILNVPEDLYSFWHSSKRFYPGINLALWSNKDADKLLEAIRSETDPDKRTEKISQLDRLIVNDAAAMFIAAPEYIYVANPKLKGFNNNLPIITASDRLNGTAGWYLNTIRKIK